MTGADRCIVRRLAVLRQLFTTKSIDAVVAEAHRGDATLKKALGPASLVALGVGAIVGTGIYATIGTASAGDASRPGAGPAIIVSFVLTAVVCGFSALCYAEFAAMAPTAGSAYTYAYATLGELVAWIIGWDLLLEYAIGNTAVAISWAGYADAFLRGLNVRLPRWLLTDYRTALNAPDVLAAAPHLFGVPIVCNALAVAIVALVTIVLVWGVGESARLNAVMVSIKILVLVFFVLACTRFVRPDNWRPFAPNGLAGIGAGASVVFFAYIGFDAVSTCAEECKNPGRDMPIGIIGSLALCTGGYVVVAAVFSGLVPYPELVRLDPGRRAEALAVAMEYARMPPWTVGVVALGSVVAQTAVLLVFQLGQPRILFAMARDGLLPPVFAKVHPRFQTPHVATILTGVFVAAVSAFVSIDEMVDLTNIGTLFAFVLVCTGITVMRYREPDRVRPFRVPFGPVLVPVLGVLSCAALICFLPRSSWLRFAGWLAVGLVVYGLYGLRHSRMRGRS
jgi:APA family basic amino acid/polyamine antiporter